MRVRCGVLFLVLAAAQAAAQAPPRLALKDLVAEALAANPEIAAARARAQAARERPAEARSLPDPMVSVGYQSSGNPLPGAGLGSAPTANIGVMASQSLPFPGKRTLAAAVAAREADAAEAQIDAVRLNVAARVKEAYYRLSYTYAASDILTRNQQLLETLLKVSETRYAAGRAAQQDVIKAQIALSVIELRLQKLAEERATRAGDINALLDRALETPVGRPDDLAPGTVDVAADAIPALVDAHAPALKRDALLVARSRTAVDAARLEFKPDFGVTGGYAYMGAMPAMYELRFDITVPLRRERRAAAVAEETHRADEARREAGADRQALLARANADYQAAFTSSKLARLYRDTVLPQARLAYESSLASYQTGSVDFLSVLSSFETVLEYEMTYADELASFHVAISRLEEATGATLAQ